eukprot:scaffold6067_cov112-Isochrysis_galbana.AAC.6
MSPSTTTTARTTVKVTITALGCPPSEKRLNRNAVSWTGRLAGHAPTELHSSIARCGAWNVELPWEANGSKANSKP